MKHDFVCEFLRFHNQAKLLHWQTKKYARHQAYGALYDGLTDLIDEFMEVHMGKYGRVKISEPIAVKNMTDVQVGKFMDELVDFLVGLNKQYPDKADTDLLNIRDEMLGLCNKVKYLLTLD